MFLSWMILIDLKELAEAIQTRPCKKTLENSGRIVDTVYCLQAREHFYSCLMGCSRGN